MRHEREQHELLSGAPVASSRSAGHGRSDEVHGIYVIPSRTPEPSRENRRKDVSGKQKEGSNKHSERSSRFSTLTRLRRRDRSEVSVFVKYIVFSSNIIFWLMGALLIVIGAWAAVQKEISSNISTLSDSVFDPVVLIIMVGCIIFIVGFFGCIGALRENTVLLVLYVISLLIILLLLIIACVLVFAFKEWLKERIVDSGLKNIIPKYRDDIDLQNFIDWVQGEWLHCCGLRDRNDWKINIYFNCSSPGIEACGFPFSCCLPDPTTAIVNRQCGYLGAVNRTTTYIESIVYTKGCVEQGEVWFNKYIVPIAGVTVAVAVVLIVSIGFAMVLRSDINAQKAKWLRSQL